MPLKKRTLPAQSNSEPETTGEPIASGSKKRTAAPKKRKGGKGNISDTKNWYTDRYQYVLVQRNILALATILALGVALFSISSLSQLAPLKSVKPFIIQVDDKTGVTQVVDPAQSKELTANEALKRYFLIKYVRARESFDTIFYKMNLETVRVMSKANVYEEYRQFISAKNPQSVLNVYGSHSRREVHVKSVTLINQNTAQLRVTIRSVGKLQTETQAVIWVSFALKPLDLTLEERNINPLGFIVESYRVDQEIVE